MKSISNNTEYWCFYFYEKYKLIYKTCLLETNGCCAYKDVGVGCKEDCSYWKTMRENEEG